MSRSPQDLPGPLSHAPFRVDAARAAGVGRGRLRSSDLKAPFYGVRTAGVIGPGVVARCHAYAAVAAPTHFFSHATAARILGLPLPGDETAEPLHVTVFLPARAPRPAGVTGHHAQPGSLRIIERAGLRLTDAPGTLRQIAPLLALDDLVVAADAALDRRSPLCSVGDLRAEAALHTGGRGLRQFTAAIALARVGAESPQETRLRLLLERAGLPRPLLNVDIRSSNGRFVARGDIVYPRWKVLVEYDGEQHRTDRRQYVRDVDRLEQLAREGWRVVRVLAAHLRDPAAIVARVRAALDRL